MKIKAIFSIIIVLLGFSLFFRLHKAPEYFLYSHDQDLASWFVKDVVINKHLRLVGQETSTQGIYIGPFFYYYLLPFYLLTNMDPIGGVYAVTLVGLIGTLSMYYIFSRLFKEDVGYIAAFMHATSYFIVLNEREVVPTQPIVLLYTAWFLFSLFKIIQRKFEYLYLLALLVALIWHINMGLILLIPLIFISILLSGKVPEKKHILVALSIFLVVSLPLIIFEFRHDFSQTRALTASLTTNQKDIIEGYDKVARTFHLTSKNMTNLLVGPINKLKFWYVALGMLLSFIYITVRKTVSKRMVIIILLWFISTFGFFSSYSKILSEYYLNGLQIIWFTILVLLVSTLLSRNNKVERTIGVLILGGFSLLNILRFINHPINESGYLQKKALVKFIKEDANIHNYPCISISYITNPGYNLGYRYFYILEKMHVNNPDSLAPVYTIVFPHSMVDRIDKSFGSLGLIYPDYNKYKHEDILKSCSGKNSNETDPLFGFAN